MAKTTDQLLVEALQAAKKAELDNIVQSAAITTAQRTLLINKGYLKQIIRGWYLLDADISQESAGESALWFDSIWHFIAQYVESKFGNDYWLSPEASLDIHTCNNNLPPQIIVYVDNSSPRTINMPNGMSLFIASSTNRPYQIEKLNGINAHSLESALVLVGPMSFANNIVGTQLAMKMLDISELIKAVSIKKKMTAGNRLCGALLAIGRKAEARNLLTTMNTLWPKGVTPVNPYTEKPTILGMNNKESPAATRLRISWANLRDDVCNIFEGHTPDFVFLDRDIEETLSMIDDIYVKDAYNSLSIEGYKVTPELIEKVAKGDWSPETIQQDKDAKDTLAAKGYRNAFNKVCELLKEAHVNQEDDLEYLVGVGLTEWATALFQPCVDVGIIKIEDMAGYRKGPIYIRGSKHVPPASEHIMDCMSVLKELISGEENPIVRAVLAHWFIGYIHPYFDGNGRSARFLMNFLLIQGGYPWAVVKNSNRSEYMQALESASVNNDIQPFAKFIKECFITV